MRANHGAALHQAVVVRKDRASANVRTLTDGGVANIGQVRNLCAIANLGVLSLAEGTKLSVLTQGSTGAQVCERANSCTFANESAVTVRADDGSTSLNGHVSQGSVRANSSAGSDGGRTV